jgi:tRNA 2-thiocytidine biosynthesis protein TtcA
MAREAPWLAAVPGFRVCWRAMNAPRIPASIRRLAGQAIAEFEMIRAGDRILVGVSGGKDSLTLLWLLHDLARRAPVPFEVGAVTVDPEIEGFEPGRLRDYLGASGIPHFFVSEPIAERATQQMGKDSFCAFCSRIKRGLMYRTAREQGYTVLALGQHLDDLAETFLMSAFHGGQLRTMKAHYRIDAGDLRVIRPLVYVRERQTRDFAAAAQLPVIPDNCPACFSKPTEREHMKALLAAEEARFPRLFRNLRTTLLPLLRTGAPPDKEFRAP